MQMRIPSLLETNMSGVTALQRHALMFCIVSKFQRKNSATLKVLTTVRKYLFNLMLKSVSKFTRVSKI